MTTFWPRRWIWKTASNKASSIWPVMITTVVPQGRPGVSLLSISVSGCALEHWMPRQQVENMHQAGRALCGRGWAGQAGCRPVPSTPLVVRPTACFCETAQFASEAAMTMASSVASMRCYGRIFGVVQVQEEHRLQGDGRFELLDLQTPGGGAGFPVHPPQRIAGHIVALAAHTRRVFENRAGYAAGCPAANARAAWHSSGG